MKFDFLKFHMVLSLGTLFSYIFLILIGEEFAYDFIGYDSSISALSYLWAMILIAIGAGIVKKLSAADEFSLEVVGGGNSIAAYYYSVLTFFLLLFFMMFYLWDNLYYRTDYQLVEVAGEGVLLSITEIIVGFLPSIVRVLRSEKSLEIVVSRSILLLSILYLYSIGTKLSVAAFVFYLSASVYRNSMIKKRVFIGGLMVIPLLGLILNQRLLGEYGFSTLFTSVGLLVSEPERIIGFALEVISFPIIVYGETLNSASLTLSDLITEINPIPGKYTNWYEIYDYHRVNYAIPFSAVGTLAHHSVFLLVVWGGGLQAIINMLGKTVKMLGSNYSGVAVALFSIFIWSMMNAYNLRACSRWLYLIFTVYLAVNSYFVIKFKKMR